MNLTHFIEDIIHKHNETLPFSGAVLVRDKSSVFEKGYGYANRSEHILNRTDTRFGIASGCKIFTAVAICQLVQEGLLSFDTYLKDCLDHSFPEFDPGITIHHLLTHSSGVPDYFDEDVMGSFEELWKDTPMYSLQSPTDFLPLFQSKPMQFAPGERFSYNNAGFILLGLIVEQRSGMAFTDYVESRIFQKCGMLDSGYYRMDQLPERTANGYIDQDDRTWRTNIYSLPIKGGPDGGAFTTVCDLIKFWDALFNHQLLSPEITNRMLIPHEQEGEQTYYGYGVWILKRDNKIFKYFVMGSDPGVIMQSSVYPESKIHAHIIGNINKGAGMIAGKIDEVIEKI
ncbi:beta-lactamase family protein [Paenibacillus sp. N1-5-1-14]|uniref:serine hydrolase domain-containing protein n=1 Tax=Paenibacillus radicibacter TaxID=2972488 RepID=UPI002158AAA4|nr:serine hydrolase [Paenibacillus radicibacter]MCR8641993.1 beta-lactamase family protein [Paenibacillus radicibacter]